MPTCETMGGQAKIQKRQLFWCKQPGARVLDPSASPQAEEPLERYQYRNHSFRLEIEPESRESLREVLFVQGSIVSIKIILKR